MRQDNQFFFFFRILIALVLGVIFFNSPSKIHAATKDVTFQSSPDDIANPERGFMKQSAVWVDKPYSGGAVGTVAATDRVVWIYFHLDNYRDPRDGVGVNVSGYQGKALEPLGSGVGLDTVNNVFKDARNKGLKLVIRFFYIGYGGIGSQSDPSLAQPDAPLSLVQQHITQLAPVFSQNKDVIAAVQFGFVGYFGEWHSSKYLYTNDARRSVMSAMLAAVPKDLMLQVRYARYKQAFFGGPVSEAQSYNQSDVARIGLYDDAFLKDDTDDGTFKSTAGGTKVTTYCDGNPAGETGCWRNFVNADSKFTPTGGEAGTHSSTPSTLQMCPNALAQLSNMHWSFIHNGYSQVVLNAWQSGGCMPEIRKRLGYRFVLNKATVPTQVSKGVSTPITFYITNEGFANMYNPRPVYLVFENMTGGAKTNVILNGTDPRQWYVQSMAQQNTVNATFTLPVAMTSGTYRIYLWLPDANSNIQSNPNYSVRLANSNIWQANTGYNLITDNIIVGTGGPTPPPTPIPPTPTPAAVNADVNRDGSVNIIDIGIIIDNYARKPIPNPNADINHDGDVNIIDIGIVIDYYGK